MGKKTALSSHELTRALERALVTLTMGRGMKRSFQSCLPELHHSAGTPEPLQALVVDPPPRDKPMLTGETQPEWHGCAVHAPSGPYHPGRLRKHHDPGTPHRSPWLTPTRLSLYQRSISLARDGDRGKDFQVPEDGHTETATGSLDFPAYHRYSL